MQHYLNLLADTVTTGEPAPDRTATGIRSIFGPQLRFHLQMGFPMVTTRRISWRVVTEELFWMLRGSTMIQQLTEKGVHIWDAWADEKGGLGPIYGAQWRAWQPNQPVLDSGPVRVRPIDQIDNVLHTLKTDPYSRRMVVSAWNPADMHLMRLPPCHLLFQLYVRQGRLSMQVYQRSADLFIGVPHNLAEYALLTHLFARDAGLEPGELIWTAGDAHVYENHLTAINTQLSRSPRTLPTLRFADDAPQSLMELIALSGRQQVDELIWLEGYNPHPKITAPVAV